MIKKILFLILLAVFISISFLAYIGTSAYAKDVTTIGEKRVYVIPIHGEINRKLVVFIKRSIEKVNKSKDSLVIFDIDTFGGRVDAALEITTLIGSLDPVTTVAYINAAAESKGVSWSAGALISFSCNRIYMAPGTSIGAAAPVTLSKGGMEAASEKVVSAVRAQIAALAEKNGYPTDVAKAMVDKDIELKEVWIDGKAHLVAADRIEEIKNRSLNSGKSFKIGRVVSTSGKLLTLTAMEMKRYGISSGTPKNLQDLIVDMGFKNVKIVNLNRNIADRIVGIITSSVFIALLIAIGLVSLYVEITTPGFGIPGTIAIISFAIIFIGNSLLGTVKSFELILFLIGVILLILEIFVIPGFGVAGISGIILIATALILSMQKFIIPSFSWQRGIFKRNFLTVGIGIIFSFIIFAVLAYLIPKMKIFSPLTLHTEQKKEIGYTVQSDEVIKKYFGKKGIAITKLRPSGKVKIDKKVIDVESDGEFVEEGDEVKVIDVSSNRIIVRKC